MHQEKVTINIPYNYQRKAFEEIENEDLYGCGDAKIRRLKIRSDVSVFEKEAFRRGIWASKRIVKALQNIIKLTIDTPLDATLEWFKELK